jgi:hypothetical protein
MLALVRPDSWNLPLFLHLIGAIVLVGGLLSVTLLLATALGRPPVRALLLGVAFRAQLATVLPGWILMRLAGAWLSSKEDPGSPTWLDIGFGISDGGLAVLLVVTVLCGLAVRRAAGAAPPAAARIAVVLAPLYLAALAVAVWAMSAKPS